MVPEVKMVFFFFHIVVKSLNYEHAIWQAIYAAQFLLGGVECEMSVVTEGH